MKIDKVLFTIDDNPHYKGFWSSISNHYKNRMGIDPVLFVIGDNGDVSSYDRSNGEVVHIKKVGGIPTIIQALIGKFYLTKTEPETTWLVGDLDLYPLQQHHFKEGIAEVDDNLYVHLNPHAYGTDWRYKTHGLPGYFHVARGSTFAQELKFEGRTFEDVCDEIYTGDRWGIKFDGRPCTHEGMQASSDWGWFCCEEMYTGHLLRDSEILVELPPKGQHYNRVDRSSMAFDEGLLRSGFYVDFHAPRPYEAHEQVIEWIASKIPM